MTTDHPVEKLGTKVMNSLDWTVRAFVGARISTEALQQPDAVESILKVLDAKAGWTTNRMKKKKNFVLLWKKRWPPAQIGEEDLSETEAVDSFLP